MGPDPLLSSTPSCYIWRGRPPGRRTNRPTWHVSGNQAAQSAPDFISCVS